MPLFVQFWEWPCSIPHQIHITLDPRTGPHFLTNLCFKPNCINALGPIQHPGHMIPQNCWLDCCAKIKSGISTVPSLPLSAISQRKHRNALGPRSRGVQIFCNVTLRNSDHLKRPVQTKSNRKMVQSLSYPPNWKVNLNDAMVCWNFSSRLSDSHDFIGLMPCWRKTWHVKFRRVKSIRIGKHLCKAALAV